MALLRLGLNLILAGIIAAKRKPFVLHLNVIIIYPSIERYLFVNPVRYIHKEIKTFFRGKKCFSLLKDS